MLTIGLSDIAFIVLLYDLSITNFLKDFCHKELKFLNTFSASMEVMLHALELVCLTVRIDLQMLSPWNETNQWESGCIRYILILLSTFLFC